MEEYTHIKQSEIIGTDLHWKAFYETKQSLVADLVVDGRFDVISDVYDEIYKPSQLIDGAFVGLEFFPAAGKNGKWLYFTVAGIRDEQGEVLGAISNMEDVTNEIESEKRLSAANSELTDFAYRVSHDLKKPLNIIRGYGQLLIEQISPDNIFVNKINESAERMLRFIDDELKLAKAGLVMTSKKSIKLDEIIKETTSAGALADFSIEVIIDCAANSVTGDRQRLSLVFTNLMENSIRYRDPAKEKLIVRIESRETENSVIITFEDNGIGIEDKYKDSIFKPGFTKGSKKGTGFGLAIVKKILEAHGGTIRVESEGKTKGTRFIIELPR
jgi:signal transduction histidine kinase